MNFSLPVERIDCRRACVVGTWYRESVQCEEVDPRSVKFLTLHAATSYKRVVRLLNKRHLERRRSSTYSAPLPPTAALQVLGCLSLGAVSWGGSFPGGVRGGRGKARRCGWLSGCTHPWRQLFIVGPTPSARGERPGGVAQEAIHPMGIAEWSGERRRSGFAYPLAASPQPQHD
jgi:hypothetical protein